MRRALAPQLSDPRRRCRLPFRCGTHGRRVGSVQMTESLGGAPPGVVALGASAGGIDALQRSVMALPVGFALAVVVVLHVPAASRSLLADIIARRASLGVSAARHGDPLRGG